MGDRYPRLIAPCLDAEDSRALARGATLLDDRSDDDGDPLVVMADPAGHPFCLIAPPAAA